MEKSRIARRPKELQPSDDSRQLVKLHTGGLPSGERVTRVCLGAMVEYVAEWDFDTAVDPSCRRHGRKERRDLCGSQSVC